MGMMDWMKLALVSGLFAVACETKPSDTDTDVLSDTDTDDTDTDDADTDDSAVAETDADGDGYSVEAGDCDDTDDTGDTGDTDEYGHPYTSYEGWETYEYGWGWEPGWRDCELWWDVSGTPTTACDECEFAFEVTLTYDHTSKNDGCFWQAGDMSWTYGYTEDYYGDGSFLMSYWYGYWLPWVRADFDSSTGEFTYEFGYEDEYRSYYWGGHHLYYYETDIYTGFGIVK